MAAIRAGLLSLVPLFISLAQRGVLSSTPCAISLGVDVTLVLIYALLGLSQGYLLKKKPQQNHI